MPGFDPTSATQVEYMGVNLKHPAAVVMFTLLLSHADRYEMLQQRGVRFSPREAKTDLLGTGALSTASLNELFNAALPKASNGVSERRNSISGSHSTSVRRTSPRKPINRYLGIEPAVSLACDTVAQDSAALSGSTRRSSCGAHDSLAAMNPSAAHAAEVLSKDYGSSTGCFAGGGGSPRLLEHGMCSETGTDVPESVPYVEKMESGEGTNPTKEPPIEWTLSPPAAAGAMILSGIPESSDSREISQQTHGPQSFHRESNVLTPDVFKKSDGDGSSGEASFSAVAMQPVQESGPRVNFRAQEPPDASVPEERAGKMIPHALGKCEMWPSVSAERAENARGGGPIADGACLSSQVLRTSSAPFNADKGSEGAEARGRGAPRVLVRDMTLHHFAGHVRTSTPGHALIADRRRDACNCDSPSNSNCSGTVGDASSSLAASTPKCTHSDHGSAEGGSSVDLRAAVAQSSKRRSVLAAGGMRSVPSFASWNIRNSFTMPWFGRSSSSQRFSDEQVGVAAAGGDSMDGFQFYSNFYSNDEAEVISANLGSQLGVGSYQNANEEDSDKLLEGRL